MISEATRKKLEQNPHYKMSAQQKREAKLLDLEKERRPMTEIGVVPTHQNGVPEFATHPTSVIKKKRKDKNEV